MLKDITLGQFFPGNTVLHRLDPRVKIIVSILYITVLFISDSFYSYGIMLMFLAASIKVSKLRLSVIIKGVKPIAFIVIFTAFLNIFFTYGDSYLFEWYFIKITTHGIITAIFVSLRILMLLIGASVLLTYTTSPIVLTDAIERLMKPLNRIRVPVHELAMMMTIALRFIPTLIEETDKIMCAQKARGADFETGNLLKRIKALIPVMVPLFISALRRADELAIAMECRCYRGGQGRTKMKQLRICKLDFFILALCIIIFTAAVSLGRMTL